MFSIFLTKLRRTKNMIANPTAIIACNPYSSLFIIFTSTEIKKSTDAIRYRYCVYLKYFILIVLHVIDFSVVVLHIEDFKVFAKINSYSL